MTLEEIFKEYERGCSNTVGKHPSYCTECLDAAVRAVKYWMGKDGGWSPDAMEGVKNEQV